MRTPELIAAPLLDEVAFDSRPRWDANFDDTRRPSWTLVRKRLAS